MKSINVWMTTAYFILIIIRSPGFASRQEDPFRQYRHEITLLNLINGLYLSTDQTVQLIEKIREAEKTREQYQEKVESRRNAFESTFKKLRTILRSQQEIPNTLKRDIHEIEKEFHQIQDQQGEALIALEKSVENILTPNQHIVIENFKPCMIPPAQGKIGQSVDAAARGIVHLFERMRRLPQDLYEKVQDVWIDNYLNKIERHLGQLDESEKEALREETLTIFSDVREMPEDVFMMQKSNLAENLIRESENNRRLRKNELGKIGRFLLDPMALSILKSRI